jgi:hypothetical protein
VETAAALSDVFQGSSISVFEFVEALEGAVRGEFTACRRVTEVAAALAPGLSVRRGPKTDIPRPNSATCARLASPPDFAFVAEVTRPDFEADF